jgi:hypothetical protein
MTVDFVGYRHAAYDTPWWAFPSSRSGRFNRAPFETVQYLCLHPLGPAAEMVRHDVGPSGSPDTVVLNLWVVRASVDDPVSITFDNCRAFGISADELVGDAYGPTQALAARLRGAGHDSVVVPSAALPGTENLILFGSRVIHPYLDDPISPDEVPTGHLSDGARAPAEVAALVRWIGHPHRSLEEWKLTGTVTRLQDPLAARW